ncbi:hypothetical protein Vi05172_g9809 [Venturia inaequalis]|nr:hypothetical protein Vi05172_g9809 [Venturia inaequalis]
MVESGSKFKTIATRHAHAKVLNDYVGRTSGSQWNICYKHAKLGVSQVGIQVRAGKVDELLSKLVEFARSSNRASFVVDRRYSNWFRLDARPVVPSNKLKIYAFKRAKDPGYNGFSILGLNVHTAMRKLVVQVL